MPFSRHERALLRAVTGTLTDDVAARLFPVRLVYETACGQLCGTELSRSPGNTELTARQLIGGCEGTLSVSRYPVRVFVITADEHVAVFRIAAPEAEPTRLPAWTADTGAQDAVKAPVMAHIEKEQRKPEWGNAPRKN
jgi:hypothetical protein